MIIHVLRNNKAGLYNTHIQNINNNLLWIKTTGIIDRYTESNYVIILFIIICSSQKSLCSSFFLILHHFGSYS